MALVKKWICKFPHITHLILWGECSLFQNRIKHHSFGEKNHLLIAHVLSCLNWTATHSPSPCLYRDTIWLGTEQPLPHLVLKSKTLGLQNNEDYCNLSHTFMLNKLSIKEMRMVLCETAQKNRMGLTPPFLPRNDYSGISRDSETKTLFQLQRVWITTPTGYS